MHKEYIDIMVTTIKEVASSKINNSLFTLHDKKGSKKVLILKKPIMTDIQLYTKLSGLPLNLKAEVSDFIDFLIQKSIKKAAKIKKRIPGKAKGLIKIKSNFDDPIEGFIGYI